MPRLTFLLTALIVWYPAASPAAEEIRRVVHPPEKDTVLKFQSKEEPVVEVMLEGQPVKLMVVTNEPVSWLLPGTVEAAEIRHQAGSGPADGGTDSTAGTAPETSAAEKPKAATPPRWVLAPLGLGKARIENEAFQVHEDDRFMLPDDCRGVIGYSTLREFATTFDFAGFSLTLHAEAARPVMRVEEAFSLELREAVLTVPGTGIRVTSGRAFIPFRLNQQVTVPFQVVTWSLQPGNTIPVSIVRKELSELMPEAGEDTFTCPSVGIGGGSVDNLVLMLGNGTGPQDSGDFKMATMMGADCIFDFPNRSGGLRPTLQSGGSMELKSVGLTFRMAPKNQPGVEVSAVTPGYPAEKAGLRPGDIILSVDGTRLGTPFTTAMRDGVNSKGKSSVRIAWRRGDAETVTSEVSTEARAAAPVAEAGYARDSRIPDRPEGVSLPLIDSLSGFFVKVRVNGHEVAALLDTGSGATMIEPGLATETGLQSSSSTTLTAAGGYEVKAAGGLVDRLELGEAEIRQDLAAIQPLPTGIRMVLGMSALRDFDVRIDPRSLRLTLWPAGKAPARLPEERELALKIMVQNPASPDVEKAFPRRSRSTTLLIDCQADGKSLPVLLDTGSSGRLSLPLSMAQELFPDLMKAREGIPVTATGIAGMLTYRTIHLSSFQLGPDGLNHLAMEVAPVPEGSSLAGYGILGNAILRHYILTLDFAAGKLRMLPLGTVEQAIPKASRGAGILQTASDFVLTTVEPGGAAEKAGLLPGDKILEVGGQPLKTMTGTQLATFQQLPPGTPLKYQYQRGDAPPAEAILILQPP